MKELPVDTESHDRNALIVRAAEGGTAGGAVGAAGALALVVAGGGLGSLIPIVGTVLGAVAGVVIAVYRQSKTSERNSPDAT